MSASDHLHGKQFWHGSPARFESGDIIDGGRSVHGVAFATDDREKASAYGDPYEVEPIDANDVNQPYEGSWEYTSKAGWRVK